MKLLDNCANLSIRENSIGSANGESKYVYFTKTIDLRVAVGEEYYRDHETFAICLNSVGSMFYITGYTIPGTADPATAESRFIVTLRLTAVRVVAALKVTISMYYDLHLGFYRFQRENQTFFYSMIILHRTHIPCILISK